MTKEEANGLKDLFADDDKTFFEKMEDLLMFANEALNDLKAKKNKLKRIKKEHKEDFITKEQYDTDFAKIERALFELIDSQVKNTSKNIQKKISKECGEVDDDEIAYEELCKLNFKHQVEYFEKLIAVDKPFIQFIIRGEKNYGQRWLYNKLIYHYAKHYVIHQVFQLDFLSLGIITMEDLIDNLASSLKVERYEPGEDIEDKEIMLKHHILAKIHTQNQFFVLENAYNFIHSDIASGFYDFLQSLHKELRVAKPEHKFIFLFVENTINKYEKNTKCMFTEEYKLHEAEDMFIEEKQLKMVDLNTISPVSNNCIDEWFDKIKNTTLKIIKPSLTDIDTFICECDNGHPEKIIKKISEKLGKTSEYPNKWLKY